MYCTARAPADLPHGLGFQVKTLALSMVLTGLIGTAGFYVMKGEGFFKTDRVELLSAQETVKMLRDPRVSNVLLDGTCCLTARPQAQACGRAKGGVGSMGECFLRGAQAIHSLHAPDSMGSGPCMQPCCARHPPCIGAPGGGGHLSLQ